MAVRSKFARSLLIAAAGCFLFACTAADGQGSQSAAPTKAAAAETQALHIGNAGLMIVQGETKIMFDPLYRNGYNNYHLVPPEMKDSVLSGAAPFDAIDAVLISHAHGDHFDALDLIAFHEGNPDALIIGPPQAIAQIEETGAVSERLATRLVPMGLAYGADPLKLAFEDLDIEAVRIPHAGGPGRREIENLVYRVTLEGAATVMHMGDADPAQEFFEPYTEHWRAKRTGTAFPPYWFFLSAQGISIVDAQLNAEDKIGVHVPVAVPADLQASGRDYFSEPGEQRTISGK